MDAPKGFSQDAGAGSPTLHVHEPGLISIPVEHALRNSQARLRLALDAANIATFRVHLPDYRFHWDERMFDMFGQSPDHFTPNFDSVAPLIDLDDLARLKREFNESLRRGPGSLLELDYRITLPDGSVRHLNSRMTLSTAPDGSRWLDGVCLDVTQRTRARQLEAERQALDSALRVMEQVLGVVGHELRTPLATMRILIEMLLNGQTPALDAPSTLMALRAETTRMADVICNILDAARLNGGHIRWVWSDVRLHDVFNQVRNTITPLLAHGGPSLNLELQPADLRLRGDADAIRRLLLNLVSNAVKHTREGSIRMRGRLDPDRPGRILLEVLDTGGGIDPHIARHIGEPFVLGDGSVTDSLLKGCGLGLTICRVIAAAHGGALHVTSEPGRGTHITADLRADLPAPVEQLRPDPIRLEKN